MSDSNYKHSASDKKLDQAAEAAKTTDDATHTGSSHDPKKIERHDDVGKDRLFENREQHDDAEKQSEKSRLAKDISKHDHTEDEIPAAH